MYTFNGTRIVARAAACTLGVIYGGEVVYYGYRALGANLLTLAAGYTAILADVAYLCSLIMARTLNDDTRGIGNKVNNAAGTLGSAKTAANALFGIYLGNTLLGVNADSIAGANLHTVAIAEAGKGTLSVACVGKARRSARLRTCVLVLSLRGKAGAVAGNECDLLDDIGSLKAHNSRHLLGSAVTAGNTKAGVIGHTVGKSLGV